MNTVSLSVSHFYNFRKETCIAMQFLHVIKITIDHSVMKIKCIVISVHLQKRIENLPYIFILSRKDNRSRCIPKEVKMFHT